MRHPPRSVLLAVAGAVPLPGSVSVPVVTASGATPACTVEHSVTSQWDTGFQGAVTVTDDTAAVNSRSLTFDFAGGQELGQGWSAEWSQSGTTVTTADRSCNGMLATGAGVGAGFLGFWSGSNPSRPRSSSTARPATSTRTPRPRRHPHRRRQGPGGEVKANGMSPMLEPHWTHGQYTGNSANRSDVHAGCQKPMPDMQYTPSFRTSVANTFKDDPTVVLDLFNEPCPDRATATTTQAWQCRRDGGTCSGDLILAGGIAYSNDPDRRLPELPARPGGGPSAAGRRGDRREHLRSLLRRPGHEVVRRPWPVLPGLDLEHMELHPGSRSRLQ